MSEQKSKPNSRVIETIQRLQAKATAKDHSGDPEIMAGLEREAMEAMALIGDLLVKYNLSMADVNAFARPTETNVVQDVVTNYYQVTAPRQKAKYDDSFGWLHRLGSVIAELCFCRVLYGGSKGSYIIFVGMPTDVEVAKTLYPWLRDQVEILAEYYYQVRPREQYYVHKGRWVESWISGCVDRIMMRVVEEMWKRSNKAETRSIVVSKEPLIDAFMDEHYSDLKTLDESPVTRSYGEAYNQGYARGGDVPLTITPHLDEAGTDTVREGADSEPEHDGDNGGEEVEGTA